MHVRGQTLTSNLESLATALGLTLKIREVMIASPTILTQDFHGFLSL
jgi:hypothetical protein